MNAADLAELISAQYRELIQITRKSDPQAPLADPAISPELSAALATALGSYLELIKLWNDRVDLVAPADDAILVDRHITDCLAASRIIEHRISAPAGLAYVDIGSGAGLPGIVLALAEPQRTVYLVEPRDKRAQFLREARRRLGISNVHIVQQRIEDLTREDLPKAGLFTARALGDDQAIQSAARRLCETKAWLATLVGQNWVPTKGLEWEIFRYLLPVSQARHSVACCTLSNEEK